MEQSVAVDEVKASGEFFRYTFKVQDCSNAEEEAFQSKVVRAEGVLRHMHLKAEKSTCVNILMTALTPSRSVARMAGKKAKAKSDAYRAAFTRR